MAPFCGQKCDLLNIWSFNFNLLGDRKNNLIVDFKRSFKG